MGTIALDLPSGMTIVEVVGRLARRKRYRWYEMELLFVVGIGFAIFGLLALMFGADSRPSEGQHQRNW